MLPAGEVDSSDIRSFKGALHLALCWFTTVCVVVYFANAQGVLPFSFGTFSCDFLGVTALNSTVQQSFQSSQAMRIEASVALLSFNFLLIWWFLYKSARHLAKRHLSSATELEKSQGPSEFPTDDMKEQLLSNLGHEVRTPVAAVCSYLDLIQRAPAAQLPALLRNARLSAQHLMDVTQNILDAAKIQAHKMSLDEEEISLRQLLVEVSGIVNTLVERKNLDFYVSIDPEVPDSVRSDPLRIKQILLNLLSNAVKFTHEGHVALVVKAKLYDSRCVFLSFAVIDTGIGIQKEQSERLFKCFSQVDGQKTRTHGGTGLGLFISRQLAELMKGSVEYELSEGLGSHFTLRIPMVMTSLGEIGHRPRYPDRALVLVSSRPEECAYFRSSLEAEYGQMHCISLATDLPRFISTLHLPIDLLVGKCNHRLQLALSSVQAHGIRKVGLVSALGQGHDIARLVQQGVGQHVIRPGLSNEVLNAFDCPATEQGLDVTVSLTPEFQTLRGKRIMLAEDTEMLREACSAYLQSHGAEVDAVANGAEAVRLALNPARRYDLILMDIQMPVMDGNQATKLIREHLSDSVLPIYALTSHCAWGEVKLSLDAGMNGHLQKPLQIREVFGICGLASSVEKPADPFGSSEADLPLLNWASGLANFSGNTTVYSRTLLTFRAQLDELLIRGRAMNWSDMTCADAYLHKCKGMALTAGASRMASQATCLQEHLNAGQSVLEHVDDYLMCLKDTRIHLNDLNAIRHTEAVNEAVDTRR